jgi:hypothetical protein
LSKNHFNIMNYKNLLKIIAVVVFSFLFVLVTFGQTKRRAKPTPTPPVRSLETEVVSRNDDNIVVLPKPSPTPEVEYSDDPAERLIQKIDKMSERLKTLSTRVGTLESQPKVETDAQQKKILLRLDILSRAEQRSESLRKQLFDLIEKENDTKTRLDDSEYQSRSEVIERSGTAIGSLRPEDVREQRKKMLETQKTNYRALLSQIQQSRANLEDSVAKADALVMKLREKLEAEIDSALTDEPK